METAAPAGLTWNDAAYVDHPPLIARQRLRGVARVAAMVALTVVCLALFLAGKGAQRAGWRGFWGHYAVARGWSRAMLALLGIRPATRGTPLAGAGVMVANHASWADILALRSARRINFVAKAEVRGWPVVGWIAAACETVFISRRRQATRAQVERLRARLVAGETLCVFAEGTSSDGLRVLPFKSALLSAVSALDGEAGEGGLIHVQPVTINWTPPPGQPAAFYGWWGTMGFEAHIWQVACRSVGGAVEVVFHEARPVADFADRKAMTRWCEEKVRAAKRLPEET
jgi:1-acyl-sn-glycerol-3-phosphate acyltransferase